MKRHWGQYLLPENLSEAFEALSYFEGSAPVIAGGTDLILRLHEQGVRVPAVVDITSISDLDKVEIRKDKLFLGACSTLSNIASSSVVKKVSPHLVEAVLSIGSVQIRNIATLVGNVANASPAADGIPPLLTMDCQVAIESKNGRRLIPLDSFLLGPNKNACEPGEVIVGLHLHIPEQRTAGVYERVSLRRAMVIAVASAAVLVTTDNGKVDHARIALGAVAPTVIRAFEAEQYLTGVELDEDVIIEAAELAVKNTSPIDDFRGSATYRKKMIRVLMLRSLRRIRDQLHGRDSK
jgi:carbon-monoxide dehydrogenase medium subunit